MVCALCAIVIVADLLANLSVSVFRQMILRPRHILLNSEEVFASPSIDENETRNQSLLSSKRKPVQLPELAKRHCFFTVFYCFKLILSTVSVGLILRWYRTEIGFIS